MTTTAPSLHPAERFGYMLATHPRLRRVSTIWIATHVLVLWSVLTAPPAFASNMAGVLNWTGITDSHGVPLGSYYLSVVSTREAITEAGPDLSPNPASWARWLGNAIVTGVSHDTTVSWLQAQVSVYVFMITMALWLLRFAMSSTWLYWLATWFRPVFDVLRNLLVDLWVFPICLVLALGYGAFQMLWHGRRGLGWSVILSSLAVGVIAMVLVFHGDPLGELYSENGLLNQARTLAFTVAQAALNNGSLQPGSGNLANINHLTAVTADAVIRHPLMLLNFGTIVDNIGGCGSAYSDALLTGATAAPAHAMGAVSDGGCGATQALAHAQQLDFGTFAVGIGFCVLGMIFTFFICYVTYSYVMVCGAAFLNAVLALFAAAPAMIAGRPRARGKRRIKEFFKHAFLVFVYVLYICFAAVIILKTVAPGGYAAQVNMTHPVAQLVMIALMAAVATGLFWWLKKEIFHDHTRQELTHAVHEAIHHTREGYDRGRDAVDKGRDMYNRGSEFFSRNKDGDEDSGDQPLTGTPVSGRPGAAKPPSTSTTADAPTSGLTETAPATGATSAAPAAGGGGAASAAGAAETGAAIAAPEVAVGVAVAQKVHQQRQHHQQQSQAASGRQLTLTDSDGQALAPATGRATSAMPGNGGQRQPQPDSAEPRRQSFENWDQPIHDPAEPPAPEPPATGRH